jgi:hypothetical protein
VKGEKFEVILGRAAGELAAFFLFGIQMSKKERSYRLRCMEQVFSVVVGIGIALGCLPGMAAAQSGSSTSSSPGAGGMNTLVTNPVSERAKPFEFGVHAQGGVGVTENRGSYRFFMVGVHAGKVLTATQGPGLWHGNFEYGMELFPLWQSYTPTSQRQNCVYVAEPFGTPLTSCSAPFTIGGTFTGISITPMILRWNFAGTRHFAPWMQGAGGLLWTDHKYPAFGGPPISGTAVTCLCTFGNNAANDDTSVWNFTPQFGVGMHYFLRGDRSVDVGANAIHISSASLGDKNPGVNASVQFTLGYSWWK